MNGATLAVMDTDAETSPDAEPGPNGWEYTVDEYMRIQDEDPMHKYEYLGGLIRLMAGGTPEHARLNMSFHAQLVPQLQGKKCAVFSSDGRVRVPSTGLITYPDLMIVCGRSVMDSEDRYAHVNPTLIVEVTSKSSERYDRGRKRTQYQSVHALREYVIVSHRAHAVDVFTRAEDGTWAAPVRGLKGEHVTLASIGCTVDVDALYRDPRD